MARLHIRDDGGYYVVQGYPLTRNGIEETKFAAYEVLPRGEVFFREAAFRDGELISKPIFYTLILEGDITNEYVRKVKPTALSVPKKLQLEIGAADRKGRLLKAAKRLTQRRCFYLVDVYRVVMEVARWNRERRLKEAGEMSLYRIFREHVNRPPVSATVDAPSQTPVLLPERILTDYSEKFFGFGNWKANVWFIGMEEGGGNTLAEVNARLRSWEQSGGKQLESAPSFYPHCGVTSWHGTNARLQPTWKQLIRMLLLMKGCADEEDVLLNYQRLELGIRNGETCLTELFPLPSPTSNTWKYGTWSRLPWLQRRDVYQNTVRLSRALALQSKLIEHRPKLVIFYGSEWHAYWGMIARVGWDQAINGKLMGATNNGTSFFVTRHPVAETDNYFSEIGIFLRKTFKGQFC